MHDDTNAFTKGIFLSTLLMTVGNNAWAQHGSGGTFDRAPEHRSLAAGPSAGLPQHPNSIIYSVGNISFKKNELLASFRTDGLQNLADLGTWNGAPVTPNNMPSDENRRLTSTINLYIHQNVDNELYVQVSDVSTTVGAFWFGTAFSNVTQTGVRLLLPFKGSASVIANPPALSSKFANTGELLADGVSGNEVDTPLSSTPGYQISLTANNTFLISTVSPEGEYGFTSLSGISGTQRIRGGGVFKLTFDRSVNLHRLDVNAIIAEAVYGNKSQYIKGTILSERP